MPQMPQPKVPARKVIILAERVNDFETVAFGL